MSVTLFCSVLFSFNSASLFAADATSGTCGKSGAAVNWFYDDSTKTLTITGTGAMKDFGITAIPRVSDVAPWKPYREKCTTVVIGEGVTTIGEHAFYEMKVMTSITLPSTITNINKRAFENCIALPHIDLNEGLLTIEQAAFKGCTSLQEIEFPDSLTAINSYAGYGAFQNCTALKTVVYGEGITSTGAYAFYQAGVENITFSSTITKVDQWCFFKCQMSTVYIPENITSLETRSFSDCTQLLHAYVYNSACEYNGVIGEDPFNGTQQILTFHGHSLSTTQTYAEEKGYQFVTLDDCAHTNSRQVTVVEPTCTEKGRANIVCDDCGNVVEVVELPANGHDYIDVGEVVDNTAVDGHTYVDQECTVCGAENRAYTHVEWVDGYNHSTTTATCKLPGITTTTCDVCGLERRLPSGRIDHNVDEYTEINEPSCTEAGSKTGVCTMCGETVTVTLPATGHTEELTSTVVSEDESHTTNSYVCTVCGATREETVHNAWVEGQYTDTVISNVSCTSNGLTERTCSICGYTEEITTQMTGHNFDYGENGEIGGTVTKEPTCTEQGTRTFTCANCGATREVPIAKLGHDYSEDTVLNEPTCTVSGTGAKVCTRCGSMTPYEIPALGHDIADAEDYELLNAPSCTTTGSAKGTCARCGEYVTVDLAVTGHSFDEENAVQTKAPTCTADGVAVATCTVCGATEDIKIPATGHHYHYLCHEDGNLGRTVVYKCADCNDRDSTLQTALVASFPVYTGTKVEDSRISSVYRYDLDEDGFITMRDYALIKEYQTLS